MVKRVGAAVAALVLAAGIGAAAAIGVWEARDDDGATATAAPAAAVQPVAQNDGGIPALVKRTVPGVVEITAETSGGGSGLPFDSPGGTATSTGSGFIIDRDGRIVTNEHVVDGAQKVTVRFHDGETADARVVGADASTDVALLQIDGDLPGDVEPLTLGSSKSLEIGEPVIAIGSPFGLEGTVTAGIVSALNREITAPNNFAIDGAIQTDAALNHGNSGGPLIDANGTVVGMNSQIATDNGGSSGVGYAVPVETIRRVVDQLRDGGSIKYPYLGVTLGDAQGGGAAIGAVRPGTPADDAGLRAGDIVTRAGDEDVQDGADLRQAVSSRQPGDRLTLQVRRDGDTRTVTVTLGTRPATTE